MADPEHLAKLEEGVEAWNAWRRRNPQTSCPDLSGADLAGAYLRYAHFTRADLTEANLNGCYLRFARLEGANLTEADLREANLWDAQLEDANLRLTNAQSTNLSYADLRGTTLVSTDLTNANLCAALLHETVFADLNLSETNGLGQCNHRGPSTIEHRTLMKSGSLPLTFLQGCGLSNWEVEVARLYERNLTPAQIASAQQKVFALRARHLVQFYSCFISFSTKDNEFARRLHADLQNEGVRCWFAPEDMKTGDLIHDTIDQTIRVHDKLLLILSETSVASAWVTREVNTALEEEEKHKKTVLFPVQLDDAVMDSTEQWAHDIRRQRHIGDFTSWKDHDSYKKAFDRLLRDLRVEGDGDA